MPPCEHSKHRPRPSSAPPLLPDGTIDVRALCARWDLEANVGAGRPRPTR